MFINELDHYPHCLGNLLLDVVLQHKDRRVQQCVIGLLIGCNNIGNVFSVDYVVLLPKPFGLEEFQTLL